MRDPDPDNDNRSIRQIVGEALESARANGFKFEGMTPQQIADDMIDYDAEIADYALDACGIVKPAYDEIVAEIVSAQASRQTTEPPHA